MQYSGQSGYSFIIQVFLHFLLPRSRGTQLRYLSRIQSRDLVVATVLISIFGVFILCHSLKFVINMMELWIVIKGQQFTLSILFNLFCISNTNSGNHQFWTPWMNIVVALSHFLIIVNCSINFIIYCFKVIVKSTLFA